jgi:hypothetical protein
MARSARGENEARLAGIIEFAVDLVVSDFEIEQTGSMSEPGGHRVCLHWNRGSDDEL